MNFPPLSSVRYFAYLPLLAIGSLFFDSHSYVLLGEIAWFYLLVIVFVRPIADIFPNIRLFSWLLPMRKELGITSAILGLAHGAGYFLDTKTSIASLSDISFWTLQDGISWGVWACVVSIPLLVTSNKWAMIQLKKHWKPLQRLTYLFFIATAIHIALVKPHEMIGMVSIVVLWAAVWIIAQLKITYTTHKTLTIVLLSTLLVGKLGIFAYEAASRPDFPRERGERQKYSGTQQNVQGSLYNQTDASNSTQSSQSDSPIVAKGKTIGKILSVNSRCIGCDKCVRIDSEHFSMNGRHAQAISQDNLDSSRLSRAISHCPVGAIELG